MGLKRNSLLAAAAAVAAATAPAAPPPRPPHTILFGAAYYDEYSPTDRVEEDARMMKAAGITVVRIAESTWGTLEPRPGTFDFAHVDRTLAAMRRQGIKVIVGTPTYAMPTWLARAHPNTLLVRADGTRAQYGARQNMDILDPDFRAAAERVIVALVDHVRNDPAVIGYQVDNETRTFGASGPDVQAAFVAEMRRTWPSLAALNQAWGLDYWSNRINDWDDFPSVSGSINASMTNAFQAFRRRMVADYLGWQAKLVRAHARPDQFVTHNFDLDWRGHSYGINPDADHWQSAKALDVAGIDIYHPTQSNLTGIEIAFGGDVARSTKDGANYLLIETQAQGFPDWTPYPGQLRLQAFSHLASGANMIEYWHWGTTANAFETYWRGLLTQDFKPNPVYDEAKTIGADLRRLGPQLADLRKRNEVAIYVSNAALSAFDSFKIDTDAFGGNGGKRQIGYNDVLRAFYDALYRRNVEVDILSPASAVPLDRYKLIIVPALYAASDAEIARLNAYARAGGHVLYTFKSGFSDQNSKVRATAQPGAIAEAAGASYQLYASPHAVGLQGDAYTAGRDGDAVRWWMEMLTPTTATVVARYDSADWPAAAAMTRNVWGKGEVSYLGFMPSNALAETILADEVRRAGVEPTTSARWPVVVRGGTLADGHRVRYVLNYSNAPQVAAYRHRAGHDLLTGRAFAADADVPLARWGVAIVRED